MSPLQLFAAGIGGLFIVIKFVVGFLGGPSMPPGLTIREEANRVVLHWNGKIEAPMSTKLAEAFETLESDPRQIILSLNSPGGSVAQGRDVIHTLRKASYARAIGTVVEKGQTCASMCVPIYLAGTDRFAHPSARFMFHQTSLRLSAADQKALQSYSRATGRSEYDVKRQLIESSTDDLFDIDIGHRSIDKKWAQSMREKIRRGDVWLTGKQLMDQGSSMVDKLL